MDKLDEILCHALEWAYESTDGVCFHKGKCLAMPQPEARAAILILMSERENAFDADLLKWVDHNKHDMGELGEFIRVKYVQNGIDETRQRQKGETDNG